VYLLSIEGEEILIVEYSPPVPAQPPSLVAYARIVKDSPIVIELGAETVISGSGR
jgi:hypothetical protein